MDAAQSDSRYAGMIAALAERHAQPLWDRYHRITTREPRAIDAPMSWAWSDMAPLVDRAVLLGKKTAAYRTGLKRGGLAPDRIVDAGRSWRRAFEALAGTLMPGDVVLLKGRHDERLERVALALEGQDVGCDLVVCNTPLGRCDTCSMLRPGWGRLPPVV